MKLPMNAIPNSTSIAASVVAQFQDQDPANSNKKFGAAQRKVNSTSSAAVLRLNTSQIQPQPNLPPPIVPRLNFDLESPTISTPSTLASATKIDPEAIWSDSDGILAGLQSTTSATSSASICILNSPSISCANNNTFQASKTITTSTDLDRSNMGQLFAHQELLDHTQRNFLKTISKKQQLHPQRYRQDYFGPQLDIAPFAGMDECQPLFLVQHPQSNQSLWPMQTPQILSVLCLAGTKKSDGSIRQCLPPHEFLLADDFTSRRSKNGLVRQLLRPA